MAVSAHPASANHDVWVVDIERGTRSRLTLESHNSYPAWTPDGARIVFSSQRAGLDKIYWKPADGSGDADALTDLEDSHHATSWSPDGSVLAFTVFPRRGTGLNRDIWILDREGEAGPAVATPFDEFSLAFSPDGRWFAYVSNESGREEIYIQPFPGPGGKLLISTDGGTSPLWSSDGREVFFRSPSGEQMYVVSVTTDSELSVSRPRLLFEGRYTLDPNGLTNYDVTSDGKRFVMIEEEQSSTSEELHVVLNWLDELKRPVRPDD